MLRKIATSFLISLGLFLSFSFAAHAQSVDDLFRHKGDPIAGNPNGKITVVEFFDYQCSHCVSMASVMASIIKKNPDVRIVYKDFPIRGPMSTYAALAAIAAEKQHKYYPLSHALLTTNLTLTESNVMGIAHSAGLNINKLKKDMKSAQHQLQANYALAREMSLNGTPAFFIGKTDAKSKDDVNFVMGEMSESELQAAIDKAKA